MVTFADGAFISINPAVHSGEPCIGLSGVLAELLAKAWWSGMSVQLICKNWTPLGGVRTRKAHVLVACWYVGKHGSGTWQRRWGEWANEVQGKLWLSEYDCPMPPREDRLKP